MIYINLEAKSVIIFYILKTCKFLSCGGWTKLLILQTLQKNRDNRYLVNCNFFAEIDNSNEILLKSMPTGFYHNFNNIDSGMRAFCFFCESIDCQ